MEWLKDSEGNQCSLEYFGSKEKAQAALDSLQNCKNCSDCYRCSDCSGCYGCYDSSGCSDCYRCSDCSDSFDCSDCYRCYRCSDCSRCYDCSDSSDSSGCSGCSRCFDCSDCSGCYGINKEEKRTFTMPSVPVIPAIHKAVYAAASKPEALEMGDWHTCKNTHCRGGWVVTLAGKEGKKLEQVYGTCLAAMKIYDASDPDFKINPCRFFDKNEEALADMKKLAEAVA